MQCANCGQEINLGDSYLRAGKNGSIFCSKECVYEAYEGFYTKEEADRTIKEVPERIK